MEIKPEDYLDVSALELYGPDTTSQQPQEVSSASDIFAIQEQLLKAEQYGDHLAVQRLSMQLDDALAAIPSKAPQEPVQEPTEALQSQPEVEPTEDSDDSNDFTQTDFNQSLVRELGQEGTDELYQIINNSGDDEVIKGFMESAAGDGEYARQVADWARNVQAAGAAPSEVEISAFDASSAEAIRANSDFAEELISLNESVASGQMTKAQLFQYVMQNPALMAEAARLRTANLLSF